VHRTRTHFAARVNRIATGLERRGIVATYELHDRLLANRGSRRRYGQQPASLDEIQREIVEQLRTEGYATIPFSQLVPDPAAWNELDDNAAGFVAETEQELERGGSALRRRAGKEFVVRKYSWGVQLGDDDPWLRIGISPRLLDVANAYLGLWSKLEYVDVWYTLPEGDSERRSSQRWHRDFNDRHLLKAFLYLVDVDEETGPFEYVPRSAPGGELDRLWPWRPLGENYPPDEELTQHIAGRSLTFTAPKGTLIFCNTAGFHRGGFAKAKPRVLATWTWDSPASLKALSERNYTFVRANGAALSDAQRYALA
jgi:hypothetical protein